MKSIGSMKETERFYPIIESHFPGCKVFVRKIFDEELLHTVTDIVISSKFSPGSTARREWKMLGKLVEIIPPERTGYFQIHAEVPEEYCR